MGTKVAQELLKLLGIYSVAESDLERFVLKTGISKLNKRYAFMFWLILPVISSVLENMELLKGDIQEENFDEI